MAIVLMEHIPQERPDAPKIVFTTIFVKCQPHLANPPIPIVSIKRFAFSKLYKDSRGNNFFLIQINKKRRALQARRKLINRSYLFWGIWKHLEHGRATDRAFTLQGFAPVLHGDRLDFLHLTLGLAFQTIGRISHPSLLYEYINFEYNILLHFFEKRQHQFFSNKQRNLSENSYRLPIWYK